MTLKHINNVLNYLKKIIFYKTRNDVVLININELHHIENFSEKRVNWLSKKILNEKIWKVPLKVEKKYKLVMDGQHRMEVAKLIGLSRVPCILYSYDEVLVWSLRKGYKVSGNDIIENYKKNYIYPYKTAKHKFPYGEDVIIKYNIEDLI